MLYKSLLISHARNPVAFRVVAANPVPTPNGPSDPFSHKTVNFTKKIKREKKRFTGKKRKNKQTRKCHENIQEGIIK